LHNDTDSVRKAVWQRLIIRFTFYPNVKKTLHFCVMPKSH